MRAVLIICLLMSLTSPTLADDRMDCRIKFGRDAIVACTDALKKKPDAVEFYLFRGANYTFAADMIRALGDFTKAITLQDDQEDAHYLRGTFYEHVSDPVHASEDYARAIDLNPTSADPYYSRGALLARAGKTAEALADLTKAIELDPEFVEAHLALAKLYSDSGKIDLALEASSRAIAIDPQQSGLYATRAKAYRLKGDTAKAEADEKTATELEPQSITIKRVMLHYHIRGKTASTLNVLQDAFGVRDHMNGSRSEAVTSYNRTWTFHTFSTPDGCRIESAKTDVTIVQLIPFWSNRWDGSVRLRQAWDRHFSALLKHENHYAQLAIKAAHEAQAALLQSKSPVAGCDALTKVANAAATTIYAASNKQQDKFDIRSRRGGSGYVPDL